MYPTKRRRVWGIRMEDFGVLWVWGFQVHQAASVACALEDEVEVEESAVNDAALLPMYNLKQKETFEDVVVNEELDEEKKMEVKQLLKEYKQIFSDVPTKTNLIEHKVKLTDSNPIKHKSYPIPYKMQEIIDKEIELSLIHI